MLTLELFNFLLLSLVEHTHASRGRKAEVLVRWSPYRTIKQYIRSCHIDVNQLLFETSMMGNGMGNGAENRQDLVAILVG
jgi:hypothetical protein